MINFILLINLLLPGGSPDTVDNDMVTISRQVIPQSSMAECNETLQGYSPSYGVYSKLYPAEDGTAVLIKGFCELQL